MKTIAVGISRQETFPVEEIHTAAHIGSGAVSVLATPWLIAFMEHVSMNLLSENIPEGSSSVGTQVDIRHLAPTPVGAEVTIRAEIVKTDGNRITFAIEAQDGGGKIGEGTHQRVIIDKQRFIRHVRERQAEMQRSGN